MWDQFSRRYTDVVLPEFRPFGRRLIELAAIRPGMWVLDVATGPGEPALTIARRVGPRGLVAGDGEGDRKSTRLNSSHVAISYAVFCLKKKKNNNIWRMCN